MITRWAMIVLMTVLPAVGSVGAQSDVSKSFSQLSGPYFGQRPPGTVPEKFAPGIISQLSTIHGRITFSPDGREVFISANAAPVQRRWYMRQDDEGVWSVPTESFLSLDYFENGLSFAGDGSRAYFHSKRGVNAGAGPDPYDLWCRDKTADGWGEPKDLGSVVNRPDVGEFAPTISREGFLYFCRELPADPQDSARRGYGQQDMFCSRLVDGRFTDPVKLGPEVNSGFHDIEPAIAPDNSYLVFTSNRPGGYSPRMNLYVTFRKADGSWTPALELSAIFKIDNIWFPSLSPDGKYLFFCETTYSSGIVGEYYWVDTKVLEDLKVSELK